MKFFSLKKIGFFMIALQCCINTLIHYGQSEFILFEHFLFQKLIGSQQFIIIMSEIHRYFWPFLLNMFLGNYDLKGKIKTL